MFNHFSLHYYLLILSILSLNYHCLFVHTHTMCHEKHTEIYKSKVSEHGAFPLVSVWVWHEEPGNVHPYNFEPIFCQNLYFGQNSCKKPQNYRFHDCPKRIFNVLDDHGTNKGQYPVKKILEYSIVHMVRIVISTRAMNKA